MTNKQAIELLKWFGEYNDIDYHGGDMIEDDKGDRFYRVVEEDLEAFDMAIKALSQQTEDAISRQAITDTTTQEILKEISSELEKMIKEHEGLDPYEMGISVGLSMARVEISNRRLDLEGIPR